MMCLLSSFSLRHIALASLAIAVVALSWLASALSEIPSIAARQRAEKKSFTDAEIVEGFIKTSFGAEFHLAGRVDRIRRYDGPVRVFADGNPGMTVEQVKAVLPEALADARAWVRKINKLPE